MPFDILAFASQPFIDLPNVKRQDLTPQNFDVIVIGLGLAGLMAAKTAADEGRRVLVVGRGAGSLGIFTNSIDVLACGTDLPIREAVESRAAEHPSHPYAKVGWENLEASLESFSQLFAPPYRFSSRDGKNSLIPTAAGTMRPTYLLPETMLAAREARMEKTLIVGIEGLKDFHPEYVAYHLKARGINVTLPSGAAGRVVTAAGIAHLMDSPAFCEQFAGLIKKRLAGENFIGLPAVLGFRSPAVALEVIARETGCRVFEIPLIPPSIPGVRIFNRFKDYLIKKGVVIIQGHEVVSSLREAKRCIGINLAHPPLTKTYRAQKFILAAGRFLGGGLTTDENGIYEPIFGLPVLKPPARRDWFNRRFFSPDPHPIHQAGILTDQKLRPVDSEGNVLWENLTVAGSILTHHDSMRDLSREGVALATGYAAGKRA